MMVLSIYGGSKELRMFVEGISKYVIAQSPSIANALSN